MLSAYEYCIVYRQNHQNANRDALSRLSLREPAPAGKEAKRVLLMDLMDDAPVKKVVIAKLDS